MLQTLSGYSFKLLPTADYSKPPSPDIEYVTIVSPEQITPGGIFEHEFVAIQALEDRLFPKDAESLGHYQKMIEFNYDPEIIAECGEGQFVLIGARHKPSQIITGGIIFQTLFCPDDIANAYGVGATCANQFTFSDSRWREHGVGNTLLIERNKQIAASLADKGRSNSLCAVFHEIADPLSLTVAEHRRIRLEGEFCPWARCDFWGNRGQRALNSINYVIPKTAEGIPARWHYRAHVNSDEGAPWGLIDYHFTTSIARCYLDGANPNDDGDFRRMQNEGRKLIFHHTTDRREHFKKLKKAADELLVGELSEAELQLPMGTVLKTRYPALFS